MLPRVNNPEGISTPDYLFKGEKWDLKKPKGNGKRLIEDLIKKNKRQANNFIIDISLTQIPLKILNKQITKIFESKTTEWVEKIIVKEHNILVCVFEKKIDRNPTGHDQSH